MFRGVMGNKGIVEFCYWGFYILVGGVLDKNIVIGSYFVIFLNFEIVINLE